MSKLFKQITTWVSIIAVVGACVALTAITKKPVTNNGTNGRNGIDGKDGDAFYETIQMFTQATPAVIGRRNGYGLGVLQRQQVDKVVVLGNSITMHSPADYWEVNDYREMSASRPDTGWVTLLRNYLNEYADISVYKTNLATWETESNGSRLLANSLNNAACEVLETGADYQNMITLANVLDDNVDCIIVQVYENVGGINTRTDSRTLTADYMNLYKDLNKLCPNAQIIQSTGFWATTLKTQALYGAMYGVSKLGIPVEPMYMIGTLFNDQHNFTDTLKSVAGSPVYDIDDNQITSITSTVAGHPNDKGFRLMAEHAISAMFNSCGLFSHGVTHLQFIGNFDFSVGEIFYTNTAFTNLTDFDRLLISGKYNFTGTVSGYSASHGQLSTELGVNTNTGGYFPCIQKITFFRLPNIAPIRGVENSATDTVFTAWSY
jgi:hypothetical protein